MPSVHRVSLGVLLCVLAPSPQDVPFPVKTPLGLETIKAPESNPMRADVFALGRKLFFDARLSADGKVACARCHDPKHGFASPESLPPGANGKRALRNASSLINRAYGKSFSWDGRARSLEEQVLLPIENPNEMALPLDDAVARIAADASYVKSFKAVFGRAPDRSTLARALACFVRGLVRGDSAVDRHQHGEREALTVEERRGLWVYESKGHCWRCHSGPNLTDERFHNTGVGVRDGRPEPGRAAITNDRRDLGKFKTPTLRGLADTAPYMHDGSIATLEDVVAFYRRGGNANAHRDAALARLDLTDADAAALVAFLRALSRPGAAKR